MSWMAGIIPIYTIFNLRASVRLSHGNRCASLIAAVKGNDFCSAGIAFNASIAALKIFEVYLENTIHIHERTSSDMMARSQVYGLHEIDIYSNSWGLTQPFSEISLDMKDAIKTSAMKGRGNLGAVHVFPVGSPGNELANNEYTITVSAIGQNGTVPSDSVTSSSVLTSGLQDGNNLTAGSMVTTSFKNKCISYFKGTSAATAQVAGIIALALEAKPRLTLADIKDLIVRSSDVSCLKDSLKIRRNAAGLKYHPVFGFGLLNATKLVDQAEKVEEGLEFSRIALRQIQACYDGQYEYTAEFCYSCTQDVNSLILIPGCVHAVKTVKVQVRYFTAAKYMRISLISPHGTESVLQDFESNGVQTDSSGRTQILTSVHFWNEMSFGLWRFKIQSDEKTDVKGNVSLTLFGIMSNYMVNETDSLQTNCTPSCPSPTRDAGNQQGTKGTKIVVVVAVVVIAIIVFLVIIICVVYRKLKNKKSLWTVDNVMEMKEPELHAPSSPGQSSSQESLSPSSPGQSSSPESQALLMQQRPS